MNIIKIGNLYRNIKTGNLYRVLGFTRHSDTGKIMAVYDLHEKRDSREIPSPPLPWVRDLKEFQRKFEEVFE